MSLELHASKCFKAGGLALTQSSVMGKPLRRQMDVWSQDRADHKKRTKRSNGTKDSVSNAPEDIRELKGNLRFPIDFT
ncbi:MAG: hypothetical protein RQ753_10755, partial [Desulfurivibrionaceae bacterium]|nr:hypothetical protein [Desulfurivibrionaceae bacterium]